MSDRAGRKEEETQDSWLCYECARRCDPGQPSEWAIIKSGHIPSALPSNVKEAIDGFGKLLDEMEEAERIFTLAEWKSEDTDAQAERCDAARSYLESLFLKQQQEIESLREQFYELQQSASDNDIELRAELASLRDSRPAISEADAKQILAWNEAHGWRGQISGELQSALRRISSANRND